MNETQLSADYPLRIGNPEDFARVRIALSGPGFDERSTHQALLNAGFSFDDDVLAPQPASEPLQAGPLIALFVEQKQVQREQLERLFDDQTLTSFRNLDLIRVCESNSSYYSPVILYPVGDVLIASDYYKPPVEGWTPPTDSVYPALHSLSLLRVVPTRPVQAVLDLCSGTAIFGLAQAKHATRVLASDITERATHFALFNRYLNDCGNVEIVRGDLYEAASGQTFDRIIAHAPYVPTFTDAGGQIWRDGGVSGEEIITRIVQSLPQYLRPGGEFFTAFAAAESETLRLEQRVRTWLGSAQSEFDVIFAFKRRFAFKEIANQVLARSQTPADIDPARIDQQLRELGFTHYASGVMGIRRHTAAANPWTFRTELSPKTNEASFGHAFDSNSDLASSRLKQLRLSLPAGMRIRETHQVDQHGKLQLTDFILECDWPFHHTVKTDNWIRTLMDSFNGRASVEELYATARLTGALPSSFSLTEFIGLVRIFVRNGYLVTSASGPDTLTSR